MKRSIIFGIVLTVFVIIILIGFFTLINPDPDKIVSFKNATTNKTMRSGIYNVGKFSDPNSSKKSSIWWSTQVLGNRSKSAWNITSGIGSQGEVDRWGRPLPYPRISISYSVYPTYTIGTEEAGENNMFLVFTVEIRNYGYEYFDAHPSKFRIVRNKKIEPLVSISNGNVLDVVIPNNSKGKGDLIFLIEKGRTFGNPRLEYTLKNYKIIYNSASPEDMNKVYQEDEDEEEKEEDEEEIID